MIDKPSLYQTDDFLIRISTVLFFFFFASIIGSHELNKQ